MSKRKKKKKSLQDTVPAVQENKAVQEGSPEPSQDLTGHEGIDKALEEYGIAAPDFAYTDDGHKTYASYEPFVFVGEEAPEPEIPELPEEPAAPAEAEELPEEPAAPEADPEDPEEEPAAPRRSRRRIVLLVLAAVLVIGAAAAAAWWRMQPDERTMSEAFGGKDRQIWYHVTSEDGRFDEASSVVSAWVFEDGGVTWYAAPEEMTLGEVASTDPSKVYNALRKENIIRFKTLNETNLKAAQDALTAAKKYEEAQAKAKKAKEEYEKELKALQEQYRWYQNGVPEAQLKALEEKYKVEIPAEPAYPKDVAEQAAAFLEAFEDGEETPESASWQLIVRNRNGATREWLAFNTEEYPQFAAGQWCECAVTTSYLCLYDGLEVLEVNGRELGGYRIGTEDGASGTDILVTPCKATSVFLFDGEPSARVSFNKGEETLKIEMGAVAANDLQRIAAKRGYRAAEGIEASLLARKTAADEAVRSDTLSALQAAYETEELTAGEEEPDGQ
ncbi:MAG: hypothetical protein IJH75_03950 [Mogibacterium sp.]|nr:hypothetical protein [Mogibacterium sp.]